MKNGYSMLLGEHVEAREVDHSDTIGFQIVCPCCKDALFKVSREARSGTSDFFSHHRTPKEMVAECELRVAGVSDAQRASENATARGQSMAAFRAVLQDAILLDNAVYPSPERGREMHKEFLRLKAGAWMIQCLHSFRSIKAFGSEFKESAEMYETSLKEGFQLSTAFSRSVQFRIAQDLATHVAQPHATKSRTFLMTYGLLRYAFEKEQTDAEPDAPKEVLAFRRYTRRLMDLIFSDDAEQLTGMINDGNDRDHPNFFHFQVFINVLLSNMASVLLKLPYQEMLRNHRNGRPMIEGLWDETRRLGVVEPIEEDAPSSPGP